MISGTLLILPWSDPLATASALAETQSSFAFLYSALPTSYSGRYSYLAWGEQEVLQASSVNTLEKLTKDSTTELPHWFGYIGYECLHALEQVPATPPSYVPLPPLRFVRYAHVLRWDHQEHTLLLEGDYQALPVPVKALPAISPALPIASLSSPFSKAAYLDKVHDALEHIRNGSFYQVNLTRKYTGKWQAPLLAPAAFGLFRRLMQASPAPYSALLWHEGQAVLSASPEQFLKLEADGLATTRPIKGTAPAYTQGDALQTSEKNRAENLMIVDLMRNDLSRIALPGSVQVEKLYDLDSFSTLHHLSSTVNAQLLPDKGVGDLLKAAFPPGSMTGAPKIAAMRWIAQQEGIDRGVYSGALGWIHGNSMETSVVIRTLIAQNTSFEFQVGGGIVADSQPEAEYQEIITKARGICHALGIDDLERL